MLFVASCELPQEPGELWWDVNLNVPFGVRTYGLWELADPDSVLRRDGSGVGMGEDSSLYFSAWAELGAALTDSLYSTPIELTIDRYLTGIEAPLDYDSTYAFSLGSLNAEIGALHGTVQNLSAHALNGELAFPLPGGYDSLEVDTGTVRLVIANRLPYAISDVSLQIGDFPLISSLSLGSQDQEVLSFSLTDLVLNQNERLLISATGSGGAGIHVDSTAQITALLEVDTVTASRFYGFVREQSVRRDSMMAIDQQHVIALGVIRAGEMTVTLANHTQFADTITLSLPNFLSRLNDTLSVTRFLQPGDSDVATVPLAQYTVRPEGNPDQRLRGRLSSHSPAPGDYRQFTADGERVYGRLEFSRLTFEYFDGILNNLELPFSGINVELERPPQGWETVRPLEVEARLHVSEGVGEGGILDATITARTSYAGSPVGEADVDIADVPLGVDTTVVIGGMAPLLAEYPDFLTAEGDAVLNGPVAFYDNTRIDVGLELRAALTVQLTGNIEPVSNVERVEPDELENIESGTATITVWNHLPTGGRCYLVADRDSADVPENSGADVDTLYDIQIPAPTIVNGRATNASRFEFDVELTDVWLDYFRSPTFYVRSQVSIAAEDGDTLSVYGGDYVSVQALAKLVYTVRPGGVK